MAGRRDSVWPFQLCISRILIIEPIFESLPPVILRGDDQKQPVLIKQLVLFVLGLGVTNCRVFQSHN